MTASDRDRARARDGSNQKPHRTAAPEPRAARERRQADKRDNRRPESTRDRQGSASWSIRRPASNGRRRSGSQAQYRAAHKRNPGGWGSSADSPTSRAGSGSSPAADAGSRLQAPDSGKSKRPAGQPCLHTSACVRKHRRPPSVGTAHLRSKPGGRRLRWRLPGKSWSQPFASSISYGSRNGRHERRGRYIGKNTVVVDHDGRRKNVAQGTRDTEIPVVSVAR